MASPLQTQVAAMSNVLAYWPLEAGSGTDYGPNGNNLTVDSNVGTNGPVLAAGGAASTVFSNAYQATIASLTSPAAPFTVMAFVNITALATYYPTLLGFSSNNNNISIAHNDRFSVSFGNSGQIAGEAIQTGTTYMFAYTYDGSQLNMYVNGRWSRNQLISGATFSSPSGFYVGCNSGTASGTYNIGHVAIFSRVLSSSELFSLFKTAVSGMQTLPTFTDTFTLVNDGMPAVNTVNSASWPANNQGYPLSGTATRPGLTTAISGCSAIQSHPSSTLFGCAGSLCGGYIRSNEQQVVIADGRSMHVACAQLDHPGVPPLNIASLANPTNAQYYQMAGRLMRDQLTARIIKTAGQGTTSHAEKGHYFSVLEQDNTGSNFHSANEVDYDSGSDGIGNEVLYTMSAAGAAMLHRYYKLPKNSWTRTYAEAMMDVTFDLFMNPNGYFDQGTNDDFYVGAGLETLLLLSPWMDSAKINKWLNNFIAIGNHWTGFSTGPAETLSFYVANSNRMMDTVLANYLLYLATGDPRWHRVYEMQYQIFFGGMPAINGVATPPAAGTYTALPAPAVAGDWSSVGGNTNVSAGGGYYGFTVVQAPTLADCSDGIGFMGESDGEAPGFDQNYSIVQLGHALRLMAWTNYDPRWVGLANMIFNSIWPYVDMTGNQIEWQTGNSASQTAGTATNDPAWSLNTQLGARQYPQGYSSYNDPTPFILSSRNLRSGYPSVSPSVMNPYVTYGPSHTLNGAGTSATQYNTTYGAITSSQIKSQWTAIEAYYASLIQEPSTASSEWRDLGRFMKIFMMHDPNCPMPRSLGH